jgi:hypothetical protein
MVWGLAMSNRVIVLADITLTPAEVADGSTAGLMSLLAGVLWCAVNSALATVHWQLARPKSFTQ